MSHAQYTWSSYHDCWTSMQWSVSAKRPIKVLKLTTQSVIQLDLPLKSQVFLTNCQQDLQMLNSTKLSFLRHPVPSPVLHKFQVLPSVARPTFPLFYTSGKYCQVLPVPPTPLLYTSARPTYSLDLKRCFAIGNEIAYQLATDISCIYVNVKCPL